MKNFENLGLPALLVESLARLQITTPTPIQVETIPLALEGGDILASAQTGTGKTIAYSIPLIMKLKDLQGSALILTPTRELAVQVQQQLRDILGKTSSLKSALLIGGAPMFKQIQDLKRSPQVIIGTPGRIIDHLERGTLRIEETRFLVIDEADRMLDMGFGIQLDSIAEYLPKERQTLMFSATIPGNIEKLSRKYLKDPKRVSVGSSIQAAPKIKQEILHTKSSEKMAQLEDQLIKREGSIIIFAKTKRGVDRLSRDLREAGHSADAIHGDLTQRRRDRVIAAFRSQKVRILVATDVAARGLDVPHVMHVINYDLPQCPEDYIHRIGRTGRAGAEGNALCFLSSEDGSKWRAIQKFMDPTAKLEPLPKQEGGGRPKRSNPRFGGRKEGFGGRKESFGPRKEGFGARKESFGPRKEGFGARKEGFGPRKEGFGARKEGFAPRKEGFGGRKEGGFKPRFGNKTGGKKFGAPKRQFAGATQD